MKRNLYDLPVKIQFRILTIVALVLMLIMQTVYYIKLTNIAGENAKSYTDSIIYRVEEIIIMQFNKASNIGHRFSFSSTVQKYMSAKDQLIRFNTKKNLDDMMKNIIDINTEILDISLINLEGKPVYTCYGVSENHYKLHERIAGYLKDNSGNEMIPLFIKGDNSVEDVFIYAAPIIYSGLDSRLGEKLGHTIIFLNPEFLKSIIKNDINPDLADFYITDSDGQIIVTSSGDDRYERITDDGVGSGRIVLKKTIQDSGWDIIAAININEVVKDFDFLKGYAVIFSLIMVLLLIAESLAFNRSIANPISKLNYELSRVRDKNFKTRIRIPLKNEIGGIADNINKTLDALEQATKKIFETQQRLYETEISQQKMQLYALQSQVNPHFLFNTLQCISGIASSRGLFEVSDSALAMADIFKYSIKEDNYVRVEDEINVVLQYLKIIDIRFGGKFKYDFDIDNEMLNLKMIKMIFQPLAENAVYHGLEKRKEGGYIRLTGWVEKDCMMFEIWDNGAGFDDDMLNKMNDVLHDMKKLEAESNKRNKIGLINIQWRIKLMLGSEYGLSINCAHEEGTAVTVRLPILP